MKDYIDMNLEELLEAYKLELDRLVDQIPTVEKIRWLYKITECDDINKIDAGKIRTMRGYLMGIRDCGKDIGDLKVLLEYIKSELDYRLKGN